MGYMVFIYPTKIMLNFNNKSILFTTALLLNSITLSATENHTYSLQQAIDFALSNNPNLQVMQDKIAQAESQLGIALSSFYPSIKTSLSYTHSTNPSHAFGMIIAQRRLDFSPTTDFNNPGGIDNYRPEVSARYSLFRGGQDYYQSKAATLGIEVAELEKIATKNQLINAVSSTFYAYLASVEADKVAASSIDAVNKELKQSRNRYEAGSTLKSDVLSLEVQLAEAQGSKIQTKNAIELTKVGLKSLLGLIAIEPLTIDSSTQWTLPENKRLFNDLLADAMQHRPEMKMSQQQIKIAQQHLNAARGAYLPKADAYIAYGSDSKDLDFSTNRDNVTAGVMVELDIFSGFRDKEKVKKAEHQLSIAKKRETQTQLAIESSVKTAHLKIAEALARVKITISAVKAAEEALRLVSEQRKAGTVTVTRYIEVEVARDKSLAGNIAARFDALRAQAELNQAIGIWN